MDGSRRFHGGNPWKVMEGHGRFRKVRCGKGPRTFQRVREGTGRIYEEWVACMRRFMTIPPGLSASSTRAVRRVIVSSDSFVARAFGIACMEVQDQRVIGFDIGGDNPGAVGYGVALPVDKVLQVTVCALSRVFGVQDLFYGVYHSAIF